MKHVHCSSFLSDLVVTSLFTPPSGRGLIIPFFFHHFYPAVRTGSSNTRFFFFTPPSGRGLVIPVFVFFLSSWSLAPDLRSVKTILAGNVGSFSVISPEFS